MSVAIISLAMVAQSVRASSRTPAIIWSIKLHRDQPAPGGGALGIRPGTARKIIEAVKEIVALSSGLDDTVAKFKPEAGSDAATYRPIS
jgi:hypothetical protein